MFFKKKDVFLKGIKPVHKVDFSKRGEVLSKNFELGFGDFPPLGDIVKMHFF